MAPGPMARDHGWWLWWLELVGCTHDCSGHLQASLVWQGLVGDTHAGKGQGKQQGPGQLWVDLVAAGNGLSSCTTVAVGSHHCTWHSKPVTGVRSAVCKYTSEEIAPRMCMVGVSHGGLVLMHLQKLGLADSVVPRLWWGWRREEMEMDLGSWHLNTNTCVSRASGVCWGSAAAVLATEAFFSGKSYCIFMLSRSLGTGITPTWAAIGGVCFSPLF